MPKFIDTHAHLDASIYERDLDTIVENALKDGVWIVTLGNDYSSSKKAVEIAERYPEGVFASVGIHPKKVASEMTSDEKLLNLARFRELATHPKVVALGETGLDYSDLPGSAGRVSRPELLARTKRNQMAVFKKFLELSREFRLPLLLHCREAYKEMLGVLEQWDKASPGFDARGIVHCFSGTWKDAKRFFGMNFSLSLTGVLLHGGYQAEVVKKAPLGKIAVESDCPYLTATPWPIRRNEPSYVPTSVEALASLRGESVEKVATETTKNALAVFKRMPQL